MSAPTKSTPTKSTPTEQSSSAKARTKKPAGKAPARPRAQTPTAARRWASATKSKLTDWLDRPMTSLHLLLAVFFLLLAFGLLMVLSSSSVKSFKTDGSSFTVFKDQLIFAIGGLVLFYLCMRIKLSWLRGVSTTGMLVALGLLLVVLAMPKINGARSWIFIGSSINFQPSEMAKFALVIWGAHVLASRRSNLGSWRYLLVPVLPIAALMAGLILVQPDLGTTAALMVIVLALFFFAGASWKLFVLIAVVGVGGLAALAVTASYRLARVNSWIEMLGDPMTKGGYQLQQGLLGMADGGFFGVGLGQSRAKWQYLPHAESDFIFAIVGEELGIVGSGLLISLFLTLAIVGLRIARRNVDPFVKLVAATSTAWLVGQAAINIFYVIGLIPVTGLPLPMISAGGTSLIVTMAIFGLLANFARREPKAMAVLQEKGPGRFSRMLGFGVPNSASQEAKELAGKVEKRKNKEWARTAARKAAQEKKDVKAATKNKAETERSLEKQRMRAAKASARGRAQSERRRREQPQRPPRPAPQSRRQGPGADWLDGAPAPARRPTGAAGSRSGQSVSGRSHSGRPSSSRPEMRPAAQARNAQPRNAQPRSAQPRNARRDGPEIARNARRTRPPRDEQDY